MNEFNHILQSFSPEHFNIILLLGLVLFLGSAGGRLFQRLKIPQVVGYIAIGIILGQSGFKLITTRSIADLEGFSSFALALIGFMIGGELKIKTLKKYGSQFAWILILEAMGAFLVVGTLVTFGAYFIFKDFNLALALGLLLGAISSATAPAATTDVLWENKTRGPLTSTVLGLVAMDDGVALLLFAVATSVAGALMGTATAGLGMSLLLLLWEIGGSILIGSLMGWGLSKLIRGYIDDDKTLVFSLGIILLIIGLSEVLDLDTILCAMAMGFFMVNYSPKKSKNLFGLVEKFTPPIYVLFFVMVGAKMDVSQINGLVAILAALFLVGRTGGKFLGATMGAVVSKAPETVKKYLPFCLLSQAGVAVGLSVIAGQTFPEPLGSIIVMVVTTTTFVVQLLGPPSVKYAVDKAGETGLNITEEDLIARSKAKDLMTNTTMIEENRTIEDILHIFSDQDDLVYPVVNRDHKVIGIITIDNLKDTFVASELSPFLLAHDIMLPLMGTCPVEAPAEEAFGLMKKNNRDFLSLTDKEGNCLGILEERTARKKLSLQVMEMKSKADALG
ncbi:MAG: cation:proton antiporter [Spirochaetales bacterium]|nr:cation:proton antiporter [Spirochaetales bacterium]